MNYRGGQKPSASRTSHGERFIKKKQWFYKHKID